ncbi:hypothetical protein FRC06_003080 [Ceratobasidium sp. 370]|nr:hypothetical protein FRC06_003080 [Ceratobasidium sp. 370]
MSFPSATPTSSAWLFDRNPLHVAHLQGPVDRLPDANLRAVYERAGKILMIQRWKDIRTSEAHAFLLFETEQAAQACCSRIGALRVTSDRQNSRPITASPLSCTNAASNAILAQWLRSQQMQPSYVIKNPPNPPPPSAMFPLSCLTPLTENCAVVVQMLREHQCVPSWWRFVAQMYVANKMWTAAQFILGQSTKTEEVDSAHILTAKGKEKQKENESAGAEDIIDISDDSIGENMSEPDDDPANDFARMQKLQQKKAPPTAPRRFGNAWLTHRRPNMQNARAKLGIVTVKSGAKASVSTNGEKTTPVTGKAATSTSGAAPAVESESEPEIEPEPEPAPAPVPVSTPALASTPATVPEPMDTEPTPAPAPGPDPEPQRAEKPPASVETTQSVRAPSSTPAPATPSPARLTTPAPSSITGPTISPPFVPTPMLGTPIPSTPKAVSLTPAPPLRSLPSTPKTSTLPRPPTLPPTPTAAAAAARTPSASPSSSRQGPTLASLVRPRTQSPVKEMHEGATGKTPVGGVQQTLVNVVQKSPPKVVQQSPRSGSDGENRSKAALPALPAGMPQRPPWIPTNQQVASGSNQESAPAPASASASAPAPIPMPAPMPASLSSPPSPAKSVQRAASVNTDAPMLTVDEGVSAATANRCATATAGKDVSPDRDDHTPMNTADKDTSMTVAVSEPPPPASAAVAAAPEADSPANVVEPRDQSQDDRSKEETGEPRSGVTSPSPRTSPSKSQTSPSSMQISPPTTQASSPALSTMRASSPMQASPSAAKRKSELDTRGFEARLKRRRHRESLTKPADGEQSAQGQALEGNPGSSAPSFASLTSGPSLASLSSGPSLTSFASLGDSAFGASLPPLSPLLPRATEEPLTPKDSIRARLLGQHRSGSPLSLSLEVTPRLDRRTPLSDMDPRTWKATLDENEALRMKIRVLELTLPTAETVKNELYAERKEKTQLIETLEIQRSLLVQSEALRKQSEMTREELSTRIKQLEDRLADSAIALEQARESAHAAAEQRRRAEEASRLADSERTKFGVLLDAERALVSAERAALAKEREARGEAETKCATTEARLAAEQRRYAEASEMAEEERAEAKNFLDAEKAIVSAQEAKLEQEREIRAELEAKLGEVEVQLKEERARLEAEVARNAEEKKAAEATLAKELKRAATLLNQERAQVQTEKAAVAAERESRSKVETELKRVNALWAGVQKHSDAALEAARDSRDTAERDLQITKSVLADLETQLAQTKERLKTEQDHLAKTEEQLSDTKSQLFTTRVNLTTANDKHAASQTELETTKARLSAVENQLLAAKNELANTHTQLSTTKTELVATQDKLTTVERDVEQRELALQSQTASWHSQLNTARELATTADTRARAADDKFKAVEQMQRRYQSEVQQIQNVLEREQEVLAMERTALAKERILRQDLQKKGAAAEERIATLERQAAESKHQLEESKNTHDGSREQLQTQRALLHMARTRIQELEQAVQRIESELDAARSAEATAKTMIQLGWGPQSGSGRLRMLHSHSSPVSDADTDFASHVNDTVDEDTEGTNPFIPLMKPPHQQSFKLKRTALPARLLRLDMPSGEPVNIDLGGLPPNPTPVIDLLNKSKCAGVFWDIIMDEYGAMGAFEAAEAVASGKLRFLESD